MASAREARLLWPELLPKVERGLAHGQGDSIAPCHILESIVNGDMGMLVAHQGERIQGAAIFEVNQFPTKKVLFVVLVVGEKLLEWIDELEEALKSYRDRVGADCIEASCRDGLVRILSRRGWGRKATIMESPL